MTLSQNNRSEYYQTVRDVIVERVERMEREVRDAAKGDPEILAIFEPMFEHNRTWVAAAEKSLLAAQTRNA